MEKRHIFMRKGKRKKMQHVAGVCSNHDNARRGRYRYWGRRKWPAAARVAVDRNSGKPLSRPTTAGTGGEGEGGFPNTTGLWDGTLQNPPPPRVQIIAPVPTGDTLTWSRKLSRMDPPVRHAGPAMRFPLSATVVGRPLFGPPFEETITVTGPAIYSVKPSGGNSAASPPRRAVNRA